MNSGVKFFQTKNQAGSGPQIHMHQHGSSPLLQVVEICACKNPTCKNNIHYVYEEPQQPVATVDTATPSAPATVD